MTPAPPLEVEVAKIKAILEERENWRKERDALLRRQVALAFKMLRERLKGLNEWRAQNQDERAHFVTRSELVASLSVAFIMLTVLLRTLGVF